MGRVTVRRPVLTLSPDGERKRPDTLAGEEPLELRVDAEPLAVTMRTPGHDVELAHGFLLGEGVLGSAADVQAARFCDSLDDDGRRTYNVLDVALAAGVPPPAPGVARSVYTTSSCGVCGKASLLPPYPPTGWHSAMTSTSTPHSRSYRRRDQHQVRGPMPTVGIQDRPARARRRIAARPRAKLDGRRWSRKP